MSAEICKERSDSTKNVITLKWTIYIKSYVCHVSSLILRSPNRPETEISFEKRTTAAALNYVKNFSIMNNCTLNHKEKWLRWQVWKWLEE